MLSPSRSAYIFSFDYQLSASQKVYHCRKLKHKGNAKPTLTGAVRVDGAVDGGSVIIGSHLAKLILK